MDIPATKTAEGIVLHVRLTPKGGISRVAGVEARDGKSVLKVQVTAPPEDGKANAALVETLAAWLGVPKSTVALVSGHKSRLKSVRIDGDPDRLLEKLGILVADPNAGTRRV
jgi:uncharacterized protein (TIGR00251 family)